MREGLAALPSNSHPASFAACIFFCLYTGNSPVCDRGVMLLICRDGVALVKEASVDYAHNPLGILGHRKIVCNHDNRAPHIVQALKQGQNLYTGLGIEGACILMSILIAAVLYFPLIHTHVVQFWYAQQEFPAFKLNSRYLARYSGRAQILLSDGSLLYEGELIDGKYNGTFAFDEYEGQGKLYRGNIPLYVGAFVAGLYDGVGKLYENGSLLYEGEFAAGKYNGIGVEYNPEIGYKVFEGRYLAGERMAAGITYDENGEAPIVNPEFLDPLTLLGESYEDIDAAIIKAGISFSAVPPLDKIHVLIDDAGGVVYIFDVDVTTKEPLTLSKVYLCNLTAAGGIVVGTDTELISYSVHEKSIPGTLSCTEVPFALALSDCYWRHGAKMAAVGSISYVVDNKLLKVYYLPYLEPILDPEALEPIESATTPSQAPSARQGGMIIFIKAELSP